MNPFWVSIGAEEGRRGWFHGEPSLPAAMAWAAFLRASREGDGPFYRRAMEGRWVWASWKAVYWGRRGRGGRSQAPPSSWRAQERKRGVASSGAPGKVGWGNTRGAEAVWSWGATRGRPGGVCAGVRRRRGRGAGRRRWKKRSVAIS